MSYEEFRCMMPSELEELDENFEAKKVSEDGKS